MTFVITGMCVRDGACAEVCPVECIVAVPDVVAPGDDKAGPFAKDLYEAEGWKAAYWIDPDVCIDCGACEPECPTEAIFDGDEVPDEWEEWTARNEEFFTEGPGYG